MSRKSKIQVEWGTDCFGRSILKVSRKTGKLSWSEVIEELHDSGKFEGVVFLLDLHITGELPVDLYDEGDIWLLYQPDDYLGKDSCERLIPKKLLPVDSNDKSGECPACHARLEKDEKGYAFCRDCGQEIYWD